MLYQFFEMNRAAIAPLRAFADAIKTTQNHSQNPLSDTYFGRSLGASMEIFERATRQYEKPQFGLANTIINGKPIAVSGEVIWQDHFCNLLHFKRALDDRAEVGPKILIVAPMSGHYATLLRGTVEALLPHGDVYITDWINARDVALSAGKFDLDDYTDYLISMLHKLGSDVHVMAVCQPSVPLLAAVTVMEERKDPFVPRSMTLMGGPIDTRKNPTAVNDMAENKPLSWFENNVIMHVPWPQTGFMRRVYPGFLQLSGFMSMNIDKHVGAQKDFFQHLIVNDGDSAEKHRDFYDEYLAVMDMSAEFYLQTIEKVFINQDLPHGTYTYKDKTIDPSAICNVALMTVEGENDDISGIGQTSAAHDICSNIPKSKRVHYMQPDVGHYGVFNGSRFRSEIAPRIIAFMKKNNKTREFEIPAE